jgi:hypothetical protein
MTIAEPREPTALNGGYAACLAAATTAAGACGFAVWEVLHANPSEAKYWALFAVAAAISATALTVHTTKIWLGARRPRPLKRAVEFFLRMPRQFLALPAPAKRKAEQATYFKMEAPKSAEATLTPGQIERERRRRAREAETDDAFRERETGASTRNASLGPGVATGFVGNLDAVVTYLRSLVPSVKYDLTRVLDRRADAATRISGALSLAAKAAAAVVVGYFLYLEGLQLRSSAYKAWAEACIERQKNAINFSSLSDLLSGSRAERELDKECGPQ